MIQLLSGYDTFSLYDICRKKEVMKKLIVFLILLGIGGGCYYMWKDSIMEGVAQILEKKLEIGDNQATVEEYYIYGQRLNITGSIHLGVKELKNLKLVLYHNEFKEYDVGYERIDNEIQFYITDKLNGGILLDEIDYGTYYLFLKVQYDTDEEKDIFYYPLKNSTTYDETTYYSLSFYQKKIVICSEDSYPTMLLEVTREDENGVYDIVLDPGHGGMDSGAVNENYKESSLTYDLAFNLKKKLESYGFRVRLTHQGNIPIDEVLDNYDENGRSVIPQKVKAKYLFSLHFNSSTAKTVNGLEIYAANGMNYDFIRNIANNIVKETGLSYSNNTSYLIESGIYSRNFTEKEIQESSEEMTAKGRKPYSISTNANYFYMIRETGGFMTGAYVDDRNANTVGENPYYNSNVGVEAYILELGYITNTSDLNHFLNNEEVYAQTLADTIYQELKK